MSKLYKDTKILQMDGTHAKKCPHCNSNQQSILLKKYTWDIYSNIEKIYAEFIKHHSRRTYRCPTVKEFKAQNWNQDVVAQYTFL